MHPTFVSWLEGDESQVTKKNLLFLLSGPSVVSPSVFNPSNTHFTLKLNSTSNNPHSHTPTHKPCVHSFASQASVPPSPSGSSSVPPMFSKHSRSKRRHVLCPISFPLTHFFFCWASPNSNAYPTPSPRFISQPCFTNHLYACCPYIPMTF